MARLSDEQLRALLFLARHPNGCTEALMMAHGFPTEMLEKLLAAGLVKASPEEMRIARRRRKVICFQITDAGRKAAADN
jgi:DNA-binding PadR family transcriptional regulator